MLLRGTNNYVVKQSDGGKVKWDLGIDAPPSEVADGIRAVAQAFRTKLPMTRVIVLGILPVKQKAKWSKCQETNRNLAGYHYPEDEVVFLDLQDRFTNPDGSLKADLYTDGTHLTTKGYEVMADAIQPEIDRLIERGLTGQLLFFQQVQPPRCAVQLSPIRVSDQTSQSGISAGRPPARARSQPRPETSG